MTTGRRWIRVDGATLEVFVSDPGDQRALTVCTTHGGMPDAGEPHWLDQKVRLVRVNPRGLGGSSPIILGGDGTAQQIIADLEQVRQAMGVNRWIFYGTSNGALLGLLYALTHPDALQGLVACFGFPSHPHLLQDPDLPEERRSRWVQVADDTWLPVHQGRIGQWRKDLPVQHWLGRLTFLSTFDVTEQLPEIRVPTLVVAGRHDFIPIAHPTRMYDAIPGAQLLVLENSGHGVSAEDEAVFQMAVSRFLIQCAG